MYGINNMMYYQNTYSKGRVYLEIQTTVPRKYSFLSYISLIVGLICFFIVFVPATRIVFIGNSTGDYIALFLTGIGILFSILGIAKKTEKKLIPIISLILSSSLFIFSIIAAILLLTGGIEFAP